ncbi:unnamed protein product [Schistosoma margrebowiei]|uniref:Uncharacterized protein n=1 Tax=Schistosoma margrebowiei TaxID=48269 RepID=A0A183LTB1_9TREM|nr:unnamed protein product [Schistosoma margrebowiei]
MRGCHMRFPETTSPSFIYLMDEMDYFSLQICKLNHKKIHDDNS